MERLLLLVDEIDDVLSALRHLLPTLLSLACAVLLFIGTTFLLIQGAYTPVGVLGGVSFCGLIIAFERLLHARSRPQKRLMAAMLQRQLRRFGD